MRLLLIRKRTSAIVMFVSADVGFAEFADICDFELCWRRSSEVMTALLFRQTIIALKMSRVLFLSTKSYLSALGSRPSARAGVARAMWLRTRGPTDQWVGVSMPCARMGWRPLAPSREGSSPEGPRQAQRRLGSQEPGPSPCRGDAPNCPTLDCAHVFPSPRDCV